jgi:hypothetical protein
VSNPVAHPGDTNFGGALQITPASGGVYISQAATIADDNIPTNSRPAGLGIGTLIILGYADEDAPRVGNRVKLLREGGDPVGYVQRDPKSGRMESVPQNKARGAGSGRGSRKSR